MGSVHAPHRLVRRDAAGYRAALVSRARVATPPRAERCCHAVRRRRRMARGTGSWPGIPANNGNAVTIGIEAAHNGTAAWSEAQYGAYLKVVRAINKRLGNPWNKVVAHKEYGAIQGKWDPGTST
ncbi:peptidoglycan recognition protein family protein [Gordonia westfalica]|nr:N-acetylmuramoyl-L-alanine amidase [Gordonia westfalica]